MREGRRPPVIGIEMRSRLLSALIAAISTGACGSDLEAARALLEARRDGSIVANPLGIEVAGYSFHWVLEPSPGSFVIALSRNLGGALLSFDPALWPAPNAPVSLPGSRYAISMRMVSARC